MVAAMWLPKAASPQAISSEQGRLLLLPLLVSTQTGKPDEQIPEESTAVQEAQLPV